MTKNFWINLSRVDLFSVALLCEKTIKYKRVMSGTLPRDGGISNSPPTSSETPANFIDQPKLDSDSPAPFFCGPRLATFHRPPKTYTELLQPDSPL